ncbi:hypothetical protein CRYUN_Cryun30bG0102400 [Craigia yunnanensis]
MNLISFNVCAFQDPLRPLVLGGDHSISFPVVRAVFEKLGGPVDILHFDAHLDIYDAFEGNKYSHASSFARIIEGGYARHLLQCLEFFNEGMMSFHRGVSHIKPGGLSFRDVLNILHNLQGNLIATDVVEFDPQRDTVDGMTEMVVAKLIRELAVKMSK